MWSGLGTGLATGLLGIGGSLASSALGQLYSGYNMEQSYKYNTKLQQQAADLQYKNTLGLTEQSPAAYKRGLEAAGLNPILAAGGSAGVNAAAPAGSVGTPTGNGGDLGSAASSAVGSYFKNKELKQLQDQIKISEDKVKSETALNEKSGIAALQNAGSNSANAESNRLNAQANLKTADRNQWQLYDAQSQGKAGFGVWTFNAGGEFKIVESYRINVVTGEAYTVPGNEKIKAFKESPSAAPKQPIDDKPAATNNYHFYYDSSDHSFKNRNGDDVGVRFLNNGR